MAGLLTGKRKTKRSGFNTTALMKYAERLDELGGSDALKRGVEAGMKTQKRIINQQIEEKLALPNLPAGGKYSTGDVKDSIDRTMDVKWNGNFACLPLGFDMDKSGPVSLFLMYGTPKMPPVRGLNNAVKGKIKKATVGKAMEAEILKVIKRLGG